MIRTGSSPAARTRRRGSRASGQASLRTVKRDKRRSGGRAVSRRGARRAKPDECHAWVKRKDPRARSAAKKQDGSDDPAEASARAASAAEERKAVSSRRLVQALRRGGPRAKIRRGESPRRGAWRHPHSAWDPFSGRCYAGWRERQSVDHLELFLICSGPRQASMRTSRSGPCCSAASFRPSRVT